MYSVIGMPGMFFPVDVNAFLLQGKELTLHVFGKGVFTKKLRKGTKEVKYILLSGVNTSGKRCDYPVIVPQGVTFLDLVVFHKSNKCGSVMTMLFQKQKTSITAPLIHVPCLDKSLPYFKSLTYKKKKGKWELVQIDGKELC